VDFYQARNELRRMDKRRLIALLSAQRISECLIGGRACGLWLPYKGFNFCVSEIMEEGCLVERAAKLGEVSEEKKEVKWSLPLLDRIGISSLPIGRKVVGFKVYRTDPATKSIIFLGDILEKRTKERGNNLKDLFGKAVKDYSYCIEGASTILLLGS